MTPLRNEQLWAQGVKREDCACRTFPTVKGYYGVEQTGRAAPIIIWYSGSGTTCFIIGNVTRYALDLFKYFTGPIALPLAVAEAEEEKPVESHWDEGTLRNVSWNFNKAVVITKNTARQREIADQIKAQASPYDVFQIVRTLRCNITRDRLVDLLGGNHTELGLWARIAWRAEDSWTSSDKSLALAAVNHLRKPCAAAPVQEEQSLAKQVSHVCGLAGFGVGPEGMDDTCPACEDNRKNRKAAQQDELSLPPLKEVDAASERALEKLKKKLKGYILKMAEQGKRKFDYKVAEAEVDLIREWINSHEGYHSYHNSWNDGEVVLKIITNRKPPPEKKEKESSAKTAETKEKKQEQRSFFLVRWWSNFWGGGTA